jgi:fatty acid CoA ligase FadD9
MKAEEHVSPGKKYALKMLALIERDEQIAAIKPKEHVGQAVNDATTYLDALDRIFEGYADRPVLGERDYTVSSAGAELARRVYEPTFSTLTYRELQERVRAIAMAWRHHPVHHVMPDEMVCAMGFASTDFMSLDFATVHAQAVSVPLQSATSGADLTEIFAKVDPAALATTLNDIEVCVQHVIEHGGIRSLIVFDYDPRDDNERARVDKARDALVASQVSTQLVTLEELIDFGLQHTWERLPNHKDGGARMAAILHSSGSTGTPKGAVIREESIKMQWECRPRQFPYLTLCIAPLNHLLGRMSIINAMRVGGTAFFTLKPDMSSLFEDMRIVRPTFMSFFPRVFEMVHQSYQNEVARRMRDTAQLEEEVRVEVAGEMGKDFLGDRLYAAVIGAAPTSRAVMQFMRETFDMRLNEGYGNTESGTGALCIDGIVQRPVVTEYRLRDVPELGYYTTDKPYPRGEFCFKSQGGITEYYKQPDATAGLFDEDGFSRTGDIVEEHGPDRIAIIDRLKDVLKLSQGEYVAVGTLGTVFEAGSGVIKQIYIYGNSLRAYLLAAVVPDVEVAEATLGPGFSETELRRFVRDELQRVGRVQGLKSFEVPRDFILEYELFSQENGLLSSVRKRLRPALKAKYGDQLEDLYDSLEGAKEAERAALGAPESELSSTEKLTKLLQIELKIEHINPEEAKSFVALGGDSMDAVLVGLAIEEIFGVSMPADVLLSPTGSIKKWAEFLDRALRGDSDRPTFESVHGRDARTLKVDDLELSKFLGSDFISAAASSSAPAEVAKTVLLTGANGFLGRCVALEWLAKLKPRGGKLICLIRAQSDELARQRLFDSYAGMDPLFLEHFTSLAEGTLEVYAGDAGDPLLGLSESTYQRLAGEVDRISHVAALVNHRFSYQNLFGPNVVGTAEIIRLALDQRLKPVDFVSSEAVFSLLDHEVSTTEDAPLLQEVPIRDTYAAGYGLSKWAGECMLQQANREFGLPVNSFRGDMMLPHRTYKGVMNVSDMFTRLLFSVIKTGLAPLSFYALMPNGSLANAHYDGTPVDIVAATVAGAEDQPKGVTYQNINIQNFHNHDGCSLDAFVHWINKAGYPITTLWRHNDWYTRFLEKLNGLPDNEKQQSALEIMGAFAAPLSSRPKFYSSERFEALIKAHPLGPELPHLDERYIQKCLADLQFLGLIDAPTV